MKLIEAIEVNNAARRNTGEGGEFWLVCGFEPLHLRTFLHARLHRAFPGCRIGLETGQFGDLAGNLARARNANPAGAAVVVEWGDLDARLGMRQLAGWTPGVLPDMERTVRAGIARLQAELALLAAACPVALCLPTLPLPPVAATPGFQAASFELELMHQAACLAGWAASEAGIRVAGSERLSRISPPADRRDLNAELYQGFPYTLAHADAVAGILADLLHPAPPRKGLITDLDNTFWRGILGEVGVDGVAWDLAEGAQVHGIYQQALKALATRGVLVGVASKNDPALVEEALGRRDMPCPGEHLYPVCAGWRPKSESVSEILRIWNIGADAVLFVDDSAMELAEVKAAHPAIECVAFPKTPQGLLPLLENLRDRFGKDAISRDDLIRNQSIRTAAAWREAGAGPNPAYEDFLAQAGAYVTLRLNAPGDMRRALELVNKTNQFNLNGRRYTESEWRSALARPGAFVATVDYRDRFGPLGIVSVALGAAEGSVLRLDSWVMSCRAFSRRIEHQSLRLLLEHFRAGEVLLDYVATERNRPVREFLDGFETSGGPARIGREEFDRGCPRLVHTAEVIS